jgi:dsRNA-specific ribonuclease
MLDVYTHRSMLSKEVDESTPHGNTERLAELGSSVLSMIVMYTLYSEKPMLPAHNLKVRDAKGGAGFGLLKVHLDAQTQCSKR